MASTEDYVLQAAIDWANAYERTDLIERRLILALGQDEEYMPAGLDKMIQRLRKDLDGAIDKEEQAAKRLFKHAKRLSNVIR